MPRSPLSLARLIPDLAPRSFRSTYWPGRFYVSRGPLERLADLLVLPELRDLDAIAQAYRAPVLAWPPPGERTVVRPDAKQALALYRAGWMFYAVGIDKYVPALSPHLRRLERELGMPPGCGRCSIFAARKGSGAPPHFDFGYGFNIQLRGRKRWWMAENRHVAEPTVGYRIKDPLPKELQIYCDHELPRAMPRDAESFVLGPGDVVFNPRGVWHRTECLDDSLSIEFDFSPRSRADVVLATLRTRLLGDEAWRRPAFDLVGGGERAAAAAAELDGLLTDLPEIVAELGSADVIGDLEALPQRIDRRWRFVPQQGVRIAVRGSNARPGFHILKIEPPGRSAEIVELSPDLVPLCRWLAKRRRPFAGADAVAAAAARVPAERVAIVIATCVETGALAQIPAPRRLGAQAGARGVKSGSRTRSRRKARSQARSSAGLAAGR